MNNKKLEERKKALIKELAVLYNYDVSKNNINKKDIKEKRINNVKDYLKGFDKEFETNVQEKIKEVPLLISLYQEFLQEVYQPSNRYKLALKLRNEINDDIEKTFTEEQQEIMKQYKECELIMIDDMTEESFIYGFSLAYQLKEESIKKYNTNKVN